MLLNGSRNLAGRKPKIKQKHAEAILKLIATLVTDLQELIVKRPPTQPQIDLFVKASIALGQIRLGYIKDENEKNPV